MVWRFVEAWAIEQLLRSPAFHRLVGSVHKGIRRIKEGKPSEEMGGTNVDRNPSEPSFFSHFKEELREQLRNKPSKRE